MLAVGLLLLAASPVPARKWTDNTGKHSVEAELAEVKGDKVVLKKSKGSPITLPIARLSKADQEYLQSLAKDEKKTEENPYTQAIRASIQTVADSEVDDLQRQLLADGNYKWKLLQKDRKELLPLLLAAQKKRPQMTGLWCHLISMTCGSPDRPGRPLSEEEQDFYRENIACLQEALQTAQAAIREDPKLEDSEVALNWLRHALARAMLVVNGDPDTTKRLAEEMLRGNVDPESWNHGNVIHKANTILGRVALREDDLEGAKTHLLESAKTRGSPQLNSFGPSFTLASELLEKGQQEAVLEYLDLVGKFWATESPDGRALHNRLAREHGELLSEWKDQIRAGKTPDHAKWGARRK